MHEERRYDWSHGGDDVTDLAVGVIRMGKKEDKVVTNYTSTQNPHFYRTLIFFYIYSSLRCYRQFLHTWLLTECEIEEVLNDY